MDSTLTRKSTNIYRLCNSNNMNSKITKLITKMLTNNNINQSAIVEIINNNKTDEKISKELAKLNKNAENLYTEENDFKRASYKWDIIKRNSNPANIKSILDFGGNVGNTAYFLGKTKLNLAKPEIIVSDVNEWVLDKWKPRSDITFVNSANLDKVPSNSVSMITSFHVLHHIKPKKRDKIIKELYRILSPNGFIVIYEHDCYSADMRSFIDIEHALYDVVVSKKTEWSKFTDVFYANYLSKNGWKRTFEDEGFKMYKTIELRNLDNSFYMFFKKG
jgi:ubiquinone/menaquinone biosynthesis C-methylase UbiE